MSEPLTAELAKLTVEDRLEAAERYRLEKKARAAATDARDVYDSVTVRLARETDGEALRRLAERDGGRRPRGPLLVAEVGGSLLAARSLADGRSIADPFVHTAHLAELLALRAAHLRQEDEPPARRRRRLAERLAPALFHS